MADHSLQSVTDLSIAFSHPLLYDGMFITLKGIKTQGEILNATQIMDNSKVVPLINGGSISITNSNRSGTITITALKVSGDAAKGDITEIATKLVALADSQGGTVRVSYGLNGATYATTFFYVTAKTAPPLKIAGDDAPDYSVEFNYGDYKRG